MEKPLLSSFSLDPAALQIAIDAGDEHCQHTAKPPRLAYAAAIRAYVREIAALEVAERSLTETPVCATTRAPLSEFRTLSPETQAELDDIDANIRNAAIRARDIFLD